jgi:hypothetical protein
MKKTIMALAMTSFVTLFSAGCTPTVPGGGANPGGGGTGGTAFATRADFLKFANCIKVAQPQAAAAVDAWIAAINSIPDAQWAVVSSVYAGYAQAYASLGCR